MQIIIHWQNPMSIFTWDTCQVVCGCGVWIRFSEEFSSKSSRSLTLGHASSDQWMQSFAKVCRGVFLQISMLSDTGTCIRQLTNVQFCSSSWRSLHPNLCIANLAPSPTFWRHLPQMWGFANPLGTPLTKCGSGLTLHDHFSCHLLDRRSREMDGSGRRLLIHRHPGSATHTTLVRHGQVQPWHSPCKRK